MNNTLCISSMITSQSPVDIRFQTQCMYTRDTFQIYTVYNSNIDYVHITDA